MSPESKTCSKCETVRPLSGFSKHSQSRDGFGVWCKGCCLTEHRAWRAKRKIEDPNWRRETHNKQLYKLSPEQYQELVKSGCHICGKTDQTLDIDHDHNCCPGKVSCGKCVRGALCRRCNLRLSFVEDSEFMDSSIRYLERWGKCF